MRELMKVRCAGCEARYYVYLASIPYDIELGDTFPYPCPVCCRCGYAIWTGTE